MALEVIVVLTCPAGAADCLARMREILDRVEGAAAAATAGSRWPGLKAWERDLPGWFVSACVAPMSDEEARAWVRRWRSLSRPEQSLASQEQRWSLPDWLYWMEPAQATWRWVGATQRSLTELEVTLAVDGLPVPLGAFKWLARTAGAERASLMGWDG